MAVGVMQALREAGLRVPDDVAVMGFDGLEQYLVAEPTLSTVTQPVPDLGQAAVQLLIDLIAEPARAPVRRLLPTWLTVRGSCGCTMS